MRPQLGASTPRRRIGRDHIRDQALVAGGVLTGDDGRLGDLPWVAQYRLDLARLDPETADLDLVIGTAQVLQLAVPFQRTRSPVRYIRSPAVRRTGRRRTAPPSVRPAEITAGQTRTRDVQLTRDTRPAPAAAASRTYTRVFEIGRPIGAARRAVRVDRSRAIGDHTVVSVGPYMLSSRDDPGQPRPATAARATPHHRPAHRTAPRPRSPRPALSAASTAAACMRRPAPAPAHAAAARTSDTSEAATTSAAPLQQRHRTPHRQCRTRRRKLQHHDVPHTQTRHCRHRRQEVHQTPLRHHHTLRRPVDPDV